MLSARGTEVAQLQVMFVEVLPETVFVSLTAVTTRAHDVVCCASKKNNRWRSETCQAFDGAWSLFARRADGEEKIECTET